MKTLTPRPVIAVLGGGLSGSVTAYNLAWRNVDATVVVVEPRAHLGHGLAYSASEPAHRINVPAAKMTMVSAEQNHFVDWLAAHGDRRDTDARLPNGDLYPQRQWFGRYVDAHLAPLLASGRITHIAAHALASRFDGLRHTLSLDDGTTLSADILVLAMTHPKPGIPAALASLANHPRVVFDPYAPDWLDQLALDERVLVIGTALTASDVIAAMDQRGHRGPITALSRRGLRSRGHPEYAVPVLEDDFIGDAGDVSTILRRIRARIAAAEKHGLSWHPVLDAVRRRGPSIWAALDEARRARLVRHLRPYWDVHRFRIAPQVEAVLDRLEASGRLSLLAARLVEVAPASEALDVSYRPRRGETVKRRFDRVIVTTGPAHAEVLALNPVHHSLASAGHIRQDALRLGIAVDGTSRAQGSPDDAPVFVAGPLARGWFGELMGVPEVTVHAELVASEIERWMQISRCEPS